jgi:hypothetical protein
MISRKITEAAIRVGADGAEWLVWQSKTEMLASGRMTSSYSISAALDQWLARATRMHMKPKRIWVIAGAAECAHRRISIPGTDLKTVTQAIPLAIEEDLPLPLSQMHWTYRTQADEATHSTLVDVVATPLTLFTEWENAIEERKIDIAGWLPEGPHLWQEMAAMRGADIDLLTVWGERRATLIRGNEQGMSSLLAYVREPGEPWEALLADLRRPFQSRDESKTILSIFTSDRLRKRILSLTDLIPPSSENLLNEDLFLGVTEQLSVPVSLLALRRLRLEGRDPSILFGDSEERQRGEFKRVATGVEIPRQAIAIAALIVLSLSLWWASGRLGRRNVESLQPQLDLIVQKQILLDQQKEALTDLSKVRADWGSVWLQLCDRVSTKTLFKDFSFGQGMGIRIDGNAENQAGVDELVGLLKKIDSMSESVRIIKTGAADKQLSFQVMANFNPAKVEKFVPKASPQPEGTPGAPTPTPAPSAAPTPINQRTANAIQPSPTMSKQERQALRQQNKEKRENRLKQQKKKEGNS